MTGHDVEGIVLRYVGASLTGDLGALRECLADRVRLDWGGVVYTDADEFVTACDRGIVWEDLEVLGIVHDGDRVAVTYEATNHDDRVRVRTSELLRIRGGRISEAIVAFAARPLA